jgi:hypothetical protein
MKQTFSWHFLKLKNKLKGGFFQYYVWFFYQKHWNKFTKKLLEQYIEHTYLFIYLLIYLLERKSHTHTHTHTHTHSHSHTHTHTLTLTLTLTHTHIYIYIYEMRYHFLFCKIQWTCVSWRWFDVQDCTEAAQYWAQWWEKRGISWQAETLSVSHEWHYSIHFVPSLILWQEIHVYIVYISDLNISLKQTVGSMWSRF